MFKRVLRVILSKTFMFAILALAQVAFLIYLIYEFARLGTIAYLFLIFVMVLVILIIFEKDDLNPAYKLMWVLIIALLPLAGVLFYLLWGHRHVPRRSKKKFLEIETESNAAMTQDPRLINILQEKDPYLASSAHYLLHHAHSPLYLSSGVEYYPIGDVFFPPYIEALRNARKYIFLEYFIYEEGYMWDTTLEILKQKAAEGLDVRVLYDGFGSLFTLPVNYDKKLRKYGIQCYAFSPLEFTIHVSDYAMLNHRDHRKITVIDGEIGFSGGLNLADEYINCKNRFGEWKDTAFKLQGAAVYSLTVTFLKAWDYAANTTSDYASYRREMPPLPESSEVILSQGLVQPYCDSPLDDENISENAYINIINKAKDYVYISTPYLILDNEMISALVLAAKNGVDVRILTPGIPDKPLVFLVTQSYYPTLLRGGVRIYEYSPGFNHAKMYVSDDKVAVIGSANMDYRSLYLHFENCSIFYGGGIVSDAKQDMIDSFSRSHEVTLEETNKIPFRKRLLQIMVRFFSPMM